MSGAAAASFVDLARRFHDVLGADGLGSEWEQRSFAVGGIEPRWVLLPSSVEECSAALRVASENDLAVVPAGFGLRLGTGNRPRRLDVVLSLARMDRIVDHAAADMTLAVEAGASLAQVNRTLAAAGQWLPFDPPFPAETSIGGLLAANVTGPARQAFGTARESLIGIRVVLADGTVVKSGGRVVKNVAGYDLHRLFVGSFGTLGVIVEACFKCRPLPEATAALAFGAGDRRPLLDLARRLAASNVEPASLELFFGDVGEAPSPVLLVGLAGVGEDVEAARRRVSDLAMAAGAEPVSERAPASEAIESIAHPVGESEPSIVLRAGVRVSALGDWLDAAAVLAPGGARFRGHTHAGVGVVRIRFDGIEAKAAARAIAVLRTNACDRGGYLVVESAPTGWTLDAWGRPAVPHGLLVGAKLAFDPRALLSPGRFVGGI